MMLYKNTKAFVRLRDGDIDFFDIVVGVWHADKLILYFFILLADCILSTLIDPIKENGFIPKKKQEADDIQPKH